MSGAVRRRLADGRWHFQHGPIDCLLDADGAPAAVDAAVERAWLRFGGILAELVGELALLRTDLASAAGADVAPRGPVARRMVAACRPHATGGRFITAMAAVAGSVAEELIGCFDADPRIVRAYVNNGGDIALHLRGDAAYTVGWVADADAVSLEAHAGVDAFAAPGLDACRIDGGAPRLDGTFRVDAASGVRGIATSGWRGRSFSLGIADSATVLARTASEADAAATVVANAVDADDPRIRRAPANRLRDDSDLGTRLVTCAVDELPAPVVAAALARGAAVARAELGAGRLVAAALCLQGQVRTIEADAPGRLGRDRDAPGSPAFDAAACGPLPRRASGSLRTAPPRDAANLGTDRARRFASRGAATAATSPQRALPTSSPGS